MKAMTTAANKLTSGLVAAAPASIDWRNNGGNFVTSIKDQSDCGSCVSFATLASIESRANIACSTPGNARDYSEAFLFYCGCGNCCATGWNFVPALTFCKNPGVALESSFPYTPGNQPCPGGVQPIFQINGYSSAASIFDRKSAVADRGPVVAGMKVYSDFFAYTGGVYRHISGSWVGNHAVCVIGYNDQSQYWICKNSWGTGWGESGFFRIAYGEAEIDGSFLFYEPHTQCPTQVARRRRRRSRR
jgi:C1A family cysteine protease